MNISKVTVQNKNAYISIKYKFQKCANVIQE